MDIRYVGMLRGPMGWARVGRGLVRALKRLGHRVAAEDVPEAGHDPFFPLEDDLKGCLGTRGSADLTVCFRHPARWKELPGPLRVGLLQYDTSHLPPRWVRAAADVDLVAVPSDHCYEVAAGAGIPREKLAVVSFGYDPEHCFPADPRPGGPLTFLHVAGPHARKGTGGVVQAFVHTFPDAPDVRLAIKTTPRIADLAAPEDPPPRAYGESLPAAEAVARFAPDDDRVSLTDERLSDGRMGELYRSADVCLQPGAAEGFSLVTLEAMACGVPAVVTGWGGHLDYCDPQSAFLLFHTIVPALDLQYDLEGEAAWSRGVAARPDYDHLADTMRLVHGDRNLMRRKGEAARRAAEPLTWEHTARVLLAELADRGLLS